MKVSFFFACAALAICHDTIALPDPFPDNAATDRFSIFPHSLCNSDFICTGTPISTNNESSTEFAVDEILWGTAPSTNVTMRYFFRPEERYRFQLGERYLVCAFTNNWWTGVRDDSFYAEYILSRCVTETNRPPNNAVLDGYYILDDRRSVIPFSQINYGGTNYWDAVRTFATNIIDIAKHKGDDKKVVQLAISILDDPDKSSKFPKRIIRNLAIYELYYYDGGRHRLHQ